MGGRSGPTGPALTDEELHDTARTILNEDGRLIEPHVLAQLVPACFGLTTVPVCGRSVDARRRCST